MGTLPSNELSKYKNLGKKELMDNIRSTNLKLKKFTKVNKKAMNQYVSFNDQQTKLLDQKNNLEKGDGAIKKLLNHLDLKKDEAIMTTFRSVQKHFAVVFKELVPLGKGCLVLQRKDDPDIDDNDLLSDDDTRSSGHADCNRNSQTAPHTLSIGEASTCSLFGMTERIVPTRSIDGNKSEEVQTSDILGIVYTF